MAYSEMETTARHTSGSETKHEAKETAGEVKQAAGELKGEVKQEVQHLTEEAKQRGQALFEGQRRAAADEIGGMVSALRKTAHELDQEHRPSTANLVGRAAESLDRVAGTLREKDLRTLYGQVEDYARQHPGMFFGGSIIAGLLLARFLKSSSEGQYRTSRYTPSERRRSESEYVF